MVAHAYNPSIQGVHNQPGLRETPISKNRQPQVGIHEDEDENRLTPLCCYLLFTPNWWQLLEITPRPCLEVFSVQFRPFKMFLSDPCYQTQGLIVNSRHTQPLSYITFFLCMCVCIDVCACSYVG